jgi:hypothetical protein
MLFGLNGKIFLFLFFRNCAYLPPSRLTMRGGRVVTNARRDAVDAKCVARRAAFFSRTAKPCGPGAPMQVPSFSNLPRGDGDNKARSHRGEHGISCKPSRRECRRKRLTCGDLLVCFFHSHTRLRVRLAPGIPCALIIRGTILPAGLGHDQCRGNAETCVLCCLTSQSDHQDNGGPSTSSCPRLSRGIHVLLCATRQERQWPRRARP